LVHACYVVDQQEINWYEAFNGADHGGVSVAYFLLAV